MNRKKDILAVISVFLILEVTAALWHLLLFRDFYSNVTMLIERPFEEYVISYLIATNFIRAVIIVLLFKVFMGARSSALVSSVLFGTLLGAVSGLTAVEYYGIWKISSVTWSLMEGIWAVLQGLTYGVVLGFIYRKK